jgi:hypothetical protein
MAAGVVAATLLQFVGALCVREYARGLFLKEMLAEGRVMMAEERRSLCEERGLPVIFEEGEEKGGFEGVV